MYFYECNVLEQSNNIMNLSNIILFKFIAFRATGCNATLLQESSFTSPNYPKEYGNNMQTWSVAV